MVVIEGTTLYVKFPIKAGNDLLCCTDYITQIPAVYEAIKNNEISLERIDESLYRILSMKIDLGLISIN